MDGDRIVAIGLLLMIIGSLFTFAFIILDCFIPIFFYPMIAALAISFVGVIVVLPIILHKPFSTLREIWLVAKGEKRRFGLGDT